MMDSYLWRSLPDLPNILEQLQNGTLTLHGGVIRHAAGTGKGGQIVAHLKLPGGQQLAQEKLIELQSVIQNGMGSLQGGMEQLQRSMNVIQGLQAANLALSGLNLAVSVAGFAIVCNRLKGISRQIEGQSAAIAQTYELVAEVRARGVLSDEADFRSLLHSSRQFCDQGELGHLKALVPEFHRQYEFTKLVLESHAGSPASNIDRLGELSLLQDRLVNLALLQAHVQMRIGASHYGEQCLRGLAEQLTELNKKRASVLIDDRDIALGTPKKDLSNVISFMDRAKKMIPALNYEADLMNLEASRPNILLTSGDSDEIMVLAA